MATIHSALRAIADSPGRLLVIGDPILDRYTWGNVKRTSPEAPVLVLQVDQRETRLGGAASLAYLAEGLNAQVTLLGVIGQDAGGEELLKLARDSGIDVQGVLTDSSRRTTVKERFIGRAATRHPQQVLRVDDEDAPPLSAALEQRLLESACGLLPGCDTVLVSDYGKGVCTRRVLQELIAAASKAGIPIVIDPAPIADFSPYDGATLITPNRLEAQMATGRSITTPDDAILAGRQLCQRHRLASAVVTLDRDGMALVDAAGAGEVFPTEARDVYDITGAGDMVMAMIGRSLAARQELSDAIRLANMAAGLEVERVGVQRVSLEEIRSRLLAQGAPAAHKQVSLDELNAILPSLRQSGRKIVLTNGCFDVLHFGHTSYLEEAAALGDILIVGLNSDASIRQLRGAERPIHNEAQRAGVLSALGCVDFVVLFDESAPHNLLQQIRPDVLVKGGDYTPETVVGRDFVESYGGRVCITKRIDDCSSSRVIRALAD